MLAAAEPRGSSLPIRFGGNMAEELALRKQIENLQENLAAITAEGTVWNWLAVYRLSKAIADIAEDEAVKEYKAAFPEEPL
jgi:hypothetical protein